MLMMPTCSPLAPITRTLGEPISWLRLTRLLWTILSSLRPSAKTTAAAVSTEGHCFRNVHLRPPLKSPPRPIMHGLSEQCGILRSSEARDKTPARARRTLSRPRLTFGRSRESRLAAPCPLDDTGDVVQAFDLEVRREGPRRVGFAGQTPLRTAVPRGDHPGRHRPLDVENRRRAVEHVPRLEPGLLQHPSVRARIRLRDAGLLRRADEVRLELFELR